MPPAAPAKRSPGAPAGGSATSREAIVAAGLELARDRPLQEVSVVLVARTLEVTPATVHYHMQSRRNLTASIMNLFNAGLIEQWPARTGDVAADIWAVAEAMYRHYVAWPGIASYAVAHSRFDIIRDIDPEERNYVIESLDRVTGTIRQAGRSPDITGIYSHALSEFVIGSAHSAAVLGYPQRHGQALADSVAHLDPEKYPNITWSNRIHEHFDSDTAFRMGCELFISGLLHGEDPFAV